MEHCPGCGKKITQDDLKGKGRIRKFKCKECGYEDFIFGNDEEMDLLDYFLENPEKCIKESERFRNEIENALRKEALNLEKGLDTSMADGDSLMLNRLTFYSNNFKIEGPEPLIARSLLVYGERNNINIEEVLEEFVQEYSETLQDDEDVQTYESIHTVWSIIAEASEGEETAYETLVKTGRGGAYNSAWYSVTMEKIPENLLEGISEPPKILLPLLSKTTISTTSSFEATLCHELTHAWLNREVENYSHDAIPSTLNEIFAYYTSYIFTGNLYRKEESELYDRPELIKWGVKLLKDKQTHLEDRGLDMNEIDFTRRMQVKVYRNSVETISPHYKDHHQQFSRANFKAFLRFCLFKEDKERLEKMRKIGENLESTFGGLKHLLFGDAKATIDNPELESELEELKEEIDWDNPEKIERRILEDIMDKAVGDGSYGTLYWVNSHITAELEKEHEILNSYITAFEKVGEDLNKGKFRDQIKEGEKQLLEVERELEKLLDDKYSVKK